jgi:hypothetical protein
MICFLFQVSQMMGQMPPEALAQMMGQAGQQGQGQPPPGTIRVIQHFVCFSPQLMGTYQLLFLYS